MRVGLSLLFALFGIGCEAPTPTPSKATDTSKALPTERPVARPVVTREGILGRFEISTERCTKPNQFEDAAASITASVVSIAAGRMEAGLFEPLSIGSGIILTESGFILASYHTVGEFEEIRVRQTNGRLLKAEWNGEDRASDLVLLKAPVENFASLQFATPTALRPGQWVAAIGSPLGVPSALTAGIVSSSDYLNPSKDEDELLNYVHSNVILHPGNSGGPLFDACGRVLAMNQSMLAAGISFSVHIDQAIAIAERLYADGEFERGYLGVSVKRVVSTGELMIDVVAEKSPAAAAGLKPGQIITHFNRINIRDERHLRWLIALSEPGENAEVSVKQAEILLKKTVAIESDESRVR